MRILVVEDDKKVAAFLQKGLREEQYAVDLCSDGVEAKYSSHQPFIQLVQIAGHGKQQVERIIRSDRIPEESLPYIFDRFYVVDKSRSRETGGSGLGLSIVKWVADTHRAEIEVQSQVNQGTNFLIKFPAA